MPCSAQSPEARRTELVAQDLSASSRKLIFMIKEPMLPPLGATRYVKGRYACSVDWC